MVPQFLLNSLHGICAAALQVLAHVSVVAQVVRTFQASAMGPELGFNLAAKLGADRGALPVAREDSTLFRPRRAAARAARGRPPGRPPALRKEATKETAPAGMPQ